MLSLRFDISDKIFLLHDYRETLSKDWISPSKRTIEISQEKRISYVKTGETDKNINHFIIAIKV